MHLLTRTVHLTGTMVETATWCREMAELVSKTIDREVAVWAANFGAPLGTYTFAMRVSGLADIVSFMPTLEGNAAYQAKAAEGAPMTAAPAEGGLGRLIHGELGDSPPPVGSLASITTATIANGRYEAAIAWSVDMAQHVEKITGLPSLFLADEYGPFGQVTWIGPAPDAESVDAATDAINSDPDYFSKLADVGELFVEASGQQLLMSRIG